ncbi:alpha-L-fucosidase-like [Watersipora subatra]|uniref:alpha-L-fucosidase-like n=1 Tax=Watersipora subatra TaxID=2589382 RepID=UPI00355BB6E9
MNKLMTNVLYFLCVIFLEVTSKADDNIGHYKPNWKSLDSRPLPSWYDEAKIGIFVHWGVFSVPALRGKSNTAESFWTGWQNSKPGDFLYDFMKSNYPAQWTYGDFANQFTAELFDATKWVKLFQDAGARYLIFVTKHREGFSNWNTNYSFNWNSMQVGPKRDIVAEIAGAVRQTDMRLGLYHNMIDWHNPLFLMDKSNNFSTQLYVNGKMIPEVKELINTFQPDLLWSDDTPAPTDYFESKQFLAWLYNYSPVRDHIVVNDRWGMDTTCAHGGYLTCTDHYNPKVLQKRKWENCDTAQKSTWGYARNKDLSDYQDIHSILSKIAQTISCGGNYVLNVGPTHDGRILPIFEERLRQMGAWLKVNGEGVYASSPWRYQNDTVSGNVWYTQKKSNSSSSGYSVYAFILEWPENNKLTLGSPIATPTTTISMLGYSDVNQHFEYSRRRDGAGLVVKFPYIPPNKLPSFYAWVLKLDNLGN